MLGLINTPVTYIWILLAALTTVSWSLADGFVTETVSQAKMLTVALMLLAFFKVRLVIMHFMELAHAPVALRAMFEGWVIVVCTAIIVMYLGIV